jgi:hypothetical protein
VQYVFINSEKGRECTVQNPWEGRNVTIFRNDKEAGILGGSEFSFKTTIGEEIALCPEGISIEQLREHVETMRTTMMEQRR